MKNIVNLEKLNNGGLFELKNNEQKTLQEVISSLEINFNRLDAQQLIAYLNATIDDVDMRANTLFNILGNTEYFISKNSEEIQRIKYDVTEHDIIQLLKRNEVDINDFGIDFDFVAIAYEQYEPALDPAILNPTRDNDLLERYKDYKPVFDLDPLVFQGGFNIIGAERATGKTRFCLSLAYHITFGMDYFLGYPLNSKGDVLYVNMEIPERDFKFFLEPLKAPLLRKAPELHALYTMNTLEDLKYTVEDITNQIARIRPKLVIIDSFKMFASFLGKDDPNAQLNNSSVLEIFKIIKDWRKNYGTTVLLTNHTNKGTSGQNSHADNLFGPGALFDYADQIFLLRKAKEPGQRLIILSKSRYKEDGSYGVNLISINGNQENTEITIDLVEEDVDESEHVFKGSNDKSYPPEMIIKAQDRYALGESTRKIGKELGVHHSTVARWVNKAS